MTHNAIILLGAAWIAAPALDQIGNPAGMSPDMRMETGQASAHETNTHDQLASR